MKITSVIALVCCILLTGCENNNLGELGISSADSIINKDKEYIVVLGDVQSYTIEEKSMSGLTNSASWIYSQNYHYNNIRGILQVGDVTENNNDAQWQRFVQVMLPIARSLPIYCVTGNHDYDWDGIAEKIYNRASSKFNSFLSSIVSKGSESELYSAGRYENMIVKLPVSNNLYLICLEFAPRSEVLEWVKAQVKEYPQRRFILMTHEFLWRNGEIVDRDSYAERHFSGTESTWTTPRQIVDDLIIPNSNIIAVLCGHNGFYLVNEEIINSSGCHIPVILFNLQYLDGGGDSQILLWEYDAKSESISNIIYRTESRETIETTNLAGYRIQL